MPTFGAHAFIWVGDWNRETGFCVLLLKLHELGWTSSRSHAPPG